MENIHSLWQLRQEYREINKNIDDLSSKLHALSIRKWILKKEMKKVLPDEISDDYDSSSSDSESSDD